MQDTLVQSVIKAAKILDILVFEDLDRKGLGLFDLARKMSLKPNTLHNLLKTLIACGYVRQKSDSRYVAGPKCEKIGTLNNSASGVFLAEKAEPILRDLSESIRENVILAILVNGKRIPVMRMNYDGNAIKVDTSFETEENLYSLNTGKILAAYADEHELDLILKEWGLPGEHWDQIRDMNSFLGTLKRLRSEGHIVTSLNRDTLTSFAVPVTDSGGRLLYALGCYAPSFRCPDEVKEMIVKKMKKAAETLAAAVESR